MWRKSQIRLQTDVFYADERKDLSPSRGFQPGLSEVLEVSSTSRARCEHRARPRTMEVELFSLVSAAHEFKTALVVMRGYADPLRNGQLGPVNERQGAALGEIQESARRLQKLIQELLLLSELRSANATATKKQDLHAAEVNEHLREIFSYWRPGTKRKSLRYEFLPVAGNPRVAVESLKLQHIVSNLIENALKFTPEHGQVVVSAMPCFWERRKAQSHFLFNMARKANQKVENAVYIYGSDTGPGIPAEHHEDIFGDFVQLPVASSRGTGLGLAIARRLVEAHDGLICVESEPGKWSKFSLLFSLTKLERPENERATHPARGRRAECTSLYPGNS